MNNSKQPSNTSSATSSSTTLSREDLPHEQERRGILVIISSPSGAGKTTLARRLLSEFNEQLEFSVSFTTRPMRVGEVDGRDYYFVSPEQFALMIERGEFAEHAKVHGNFYGTSRATVEKALANGVDVVFDVDWQGGESLSAQWPNDALMIFIVPPSLPTLESRLRRRATDSPEVIERRLRVALSELAHHTTYQHVVVNDDLDVAYGQLRAIYENRREQCKDCEAGTSVSQLVTDDARLHAERLVALTE